MPFVPVPTTALVEVRMEQDNQQVENTLWFEFGGGVSAPTLAAITAMVFDWWTTDLAPLISDQVTLREIVTTDMTSATSGVDSFTPPTLETGGIATPALPNNVSLTVSFRTALRGRSFRGRNFIVGLTEVQVANNQVVASVVTAFRSAYATLIADSATLGAPWVVASRFSGVDVNGNPIPRASGVTTPITSVVIVDDTVDSMRRRLPGRGN